MLINVARWHSFVVSPKELASSNSFYFYSIGTMINMTLPFRMGDFVRSSLIAGALKIPNTKALGTIASEHMLDMLILGLLLVGCILSYSYHWPARIIPIMTFFCIIIALFIVGFFLVQKNEATKQKLKQFIGNSLPKRFLFIPEMITNFCGGIFQFGGYANTLKIFSLTAGILLAQGLWIYILLNALDIPNSYHLGIEAVIVLIVMLGVAVMIPSSPSYIGTFHLMVVLGLTQMGVPKAAALSFAILAHAHTVITAVSIGCYSLWKGKIKLSFNYRTWGMPNVAQEMP
jgi:uncharacterized protein (TIRG00374 family)